MNGQVGDDGPLEARYAAMMKQVLDRSPTRGDGIAEAEIRAAEARLSVHLPDAMRRYYRYLGNVSELN